MAAVVVMPKLGLSMTTGKVAEWLKGPGEAVAKGEKLLVVETEKISIEVDAPADGVLRHVLVPVGESVPISAPLAVIASPDEEIDLAAISAVAARQQVPDAAAAPAASRERAPDASTAAPGRPIAATPAARKLAREHGLDVATVTGTGPGGRITYDDVERAVAARRKAASAPPGARAVAFYSDGLKLSGALFLPPGPRASPGPGVVLCAGIQGVKDVALPDLARALAERGIATLTFDYRGFGRSEGARGRLFPHEQVRDARAALTYLSLQNEVEPALLGLAGISLGGGHALAAAAADPRARAVAAIEPVTDGRRWLRRLRREWEWRTFQEELTRDRLERSTGGASRRVSLHEVMPPDPETETILAVMARANPALDLAPRLSLESAEALIEYQPQATIDRIAPRATLLVHGELDVLVPPDESIEAAARAGEPKRLAILPGMGHLNWLRPEHPVFRQVVDLVADWFAGHLRGDERRG